jgi:mannosyltransferase OCH1-like enzyme
MPEFSIIPKQLKARNSIEDYQRIPRIVWQTMKTNRVPLYMKNYADSWIELNPEYEYRFLDDYDIIDFIKKDFPEYLECYKKLKHGASKADLWRYLIIYKNGGVYADMDCKCLTPLNQWIDPQAAFVTQLGINKDVCQWLIISVPQNPIFLRAAQKTLFNSENNNNTTSHFGFEYVQNKLVVNKNSPVMIFDHPVLGLSGPPVLQKAAEECFEEGTIEKILESTQIMCVSDPINSCHMNGNVIHDTRNIKYKNTLKQLNIKHYNTRWERLKRKMKKFILSH